MKLPRWFTITTTTIFPFMSLEMLYDPRNSIRRSHHRDNPAKKSPLTMWPLWTSRIFKMFAISQGPDGGRTLHAPQKNTRGSHCTDPQRSNTSPHTQDLIVWNFLSLPVLKREVLSWQPTTKREVQRLL